MNSKATGPGATPLEATITTPPVDPLQYGLALFHATPPDHVRAAGWFRAAADNGDREGLAMLGLCLLEGLGLPADVTEARTLLTLAADRGSAVGRFQLGRMLMTGRGAPADEEAGLWAYVAASAQGHAEATFNLANCLFAGVGCLPDRLAAKALYLRSRTLGCPLRPQGVRVRQRELTAVRALAQRFADPDRLVFLMRERQQELALVHAVAQTEPRPAREAQAEKPPQAWRQAGRLAVGVVAAMAGSVGQALKPMAGDAGPTTINF